MEELGAAFIGALVAYVGGWWQERSARVRRRKALASALLFELRLMEANMRDTAEAERPSEQAPGVDPHPLHDALLADMVLLNPQSVQAVLTAYGWFRDNRNKLNQVRQGLLPSSPEQDAELRRRARIGVESVPAAYEALVNEGGLPPYGDYWQATDANKPLPKTPFKLKP